MRIYQKPIAHRGLHDKDAPENSMASFEKALEKGYNIEIDVRMTKDKKVVIFHDNTTDRLTETSGRIAELTYEQLQEERYHLANGEVIPLLEDLIQLVDGKVDILCEIKSTGISPLESEVYKIIKGKPWIIVQAFNPITLVWYKKNAPEVIRGQLATSSQKKCMKPLFSAAFKMLKLTKPAFFAYDVRYLPSDKLNKAVAKHNLKLLSWTIKTEEDLKKAKENNVDNIIFENISPEGFLK